MPAIGKHPKTSKKRGKIEFGKRPYFFEVTEDDAKGSVVADTENCAAACALKADPHIEQAWVTRTRTVIKFSADHPDAEFAGKFLRWINPVELQRSVDQFDHTAGTFPPGGYRLQVISPSEQNDARFRNRKANPKRRRPRRRSSYSMR